MSRREALANTDLPAQGQVQPAPGGDTFSSGRDEFYTLSNPSNLNGGIVTKKRINFFSLPNSQSVDDSATARYAEFQTNIQAIEQETNVVINTDFSNQPQLSQEDINKIKLARILDILYGQIGRITPDFSLREGDRVTERWMEVVKNKIYEKIVTGQNISDYVRHLYKSIFYSSFNEKMEYKADEQRKTSYSKIKEMSDWQDFVYENSDARDHKFAELERLLAADIDALVKSVLPNQATMSPEEIFHAKSRMLFDQLMIIANDPDLGIADFVRQEREEGDDSWENRLRNDVFAKALGNYKSILEFSVSLLRAVFYGSFNADMTKKDSEARKQFYSKMKSAADLKDCSDGAAAELNKLFFSIKHPSSLWPEVKDKLIQELLDHVHPYSQVHLESWVNFLLTGDHGSDVHLYAASTDIMMENVRRAIEKITFRSGQVAEDLLIEKVIQLCEAAEINMQIINNKEVAEGRPAMVKGSLDSTDYECRYFEEVEKLILDSPYQIIQDLKTEILEAAQKFAQEERNQEELIKFIKEAVSQKITQPEDPAAKHGFSNPRTLELINLIIKVNCYMAKNMELPVVLLKYLLHKVVPEGLQSLAARGFEDVENIVTARLDAIAEEISQDLNIPLKLLKMRDAETGELVLRCQVPSEYYRVEGASPARLLQASLDSGEPLRSIEGTLNNFIAHRQPEERIRLSLAGLIFHPSLSLIFDAFEREGSGTILLKLKEFVERAIILGDRIAVRELIEWAMTNQVLEMWVNRGLNITIPHIKFLYRTYSDALEESNSPNQHLLKSNLILGILSCPFERTDVVNGNFVSDGVPNICRYLEYSNDKTEILRFAQEQIGAGSLISYLSGHDIVVDRFSLKRPQLIADVIVNRDPQRKLLEYIDELYRTSDEIDKAEMSNLNHAIAGCLIEKESYLEGLDFCRRAVAQCADAKLTLGVFFMTNRGEINADPRESEKWLQELCADFTAPLMTKLRAKYNLGSLYSSNYEGFPTNYALAERHIVEAIAEYQTSGMVQDERIYSKFTAKLSEIRELAHASQGIRSGAASPLSGDAKRSRGNDQ